MPDPEDHNLVAWREKSGDTIPTIKKFLDVNLESEEWGEHIDINQVTNFLHDQPYGEHVSALIKDKEMKDPDIDFYEYNLTLEDGDEIRDMLYIVSGDEHNYMIGREGGLTSLERKSRQTSSRINAGLYQLYKTTGEKLDEYQGKAALAEANLHLFQQQVEDTLDEKLPDWL